MRAFSPVAPTIRRRAGETSPQWKLRGQCGLRARIRNTWAAGRDDRGPGPAVRRQGTMQAAKWSIAAAVCACLAAGAAKADTWGLLVGVSKYESRGIQSLTYPAADATALRDALVDPKLGRLPADHVKLLTNEQATRDNIMAGVTDFLAKNVKKGDAVIVSVAGHGVSKGVGIGAKSYFLSTDAKGASKEALESSAVDLRALCTEIGKLPAAQFILFVDACREDPTPGRGLKPNTQSDSLARAVRVVADKDNGPVDSVTFYACQVGQRAYEDTTYQHGVFTYWILDAIKEAAGAVPPDGRIEMGRLASYVRAKVKKWGDQASVEQTPELTFNDPDARGSDPVYFVRVNREPANPLTVEPPLLVLDTNPDTAAVFLNGVKVGSGSQSKEMKEGDNTVRIEAPGYAPVEKTFHALPGYEYQLQATLAPGKAAAAGDPPPPDSTIQMSVQFRKAQALEAGERWDEAMGLYQGLVGQKYGPAYERLAGLQQRKGNIDDAIDTLVKLNRDTTPTSHSYSLLARAYTTYSLKENAKNPPKADEKKSGDDVSIGGIKIRNPFGRKKKPESRAPVTAEAAGDFRKPENGAAAAALARKAADEASKADANGVDAYLAQGFSLVAADREGKNAGDAIAAFRSAVTAAPNDATTNYALGFGQYFFSRFQKDRGPREQQLQDAITSLDRAITLRPNYYEALHIRAYCHHLLGHGKQAQQDYDAAIANRGSATDPDEVASLNVAQSALLREEAAGANGQQKTDLMNASDGYVSDAKDITPDLREALRMLKGAGFGGRLTDFLDAPLREIYNKIPSLPGLNLPGFSLPGLHF
jgi:tetratricopeptide (TPR) repeat protein